MTAVSGPATADSVSALDRLHFALNEAEFNFGDGGPAFVNPATAIAGLSAPSIRRAYLTRELERIEGLVVGLSRRHAEKPADQRITAALAGAKTMARRLRADLGMPPDSARPVGQSSAQAAPTAAMSGDDNHLMLRFRPATAAASSVAYRNVNGDGVRGRIVTGTHSLEFMPSARLTTGIFARSRVGEAWSPYEAVRTVSAGWGVGGASSLELDSVLTLSTAMMYGGSWNQTSLDGIGANFDSDRLVADARLDRRSWRGSWLFVPGLSVHYEQAGRGAFVDRAGEQVPEERHTFGRVSATTEVSRSFLDPSGDRILTFHPFVRAGANLEMRPWDDLAGDTFLDSAEASALIGSGLRFHFGDQSSLLFANEYTRDEEDGLFRLLAQFETPFGQHRPGQPVNTLSLTADADQTGSVGATLNATVPLR